MEDFALLLNEARRAARPVDCDALRWIGTGLLEMVDLVAAAERVDFVEAEEAESAAEGLKSLFKLYRQFSEKLLDVQ